MSDLGTLRVSAYITCGCLALHAFLVGKQSPADKWKVNMCFNVFKNHDNDKSNICDVINNNVPHCEHIILYGGRIGMEHFIVLIVFLMFNYEFIRY
jgi:hypothetical protein